MKPIFHFLVAIVAALFSILSASSQERIPSVNTKELVIDGVHAYDIGEYEDALEYFEQINPNDTNGYLAFYETALTLNALEKYDECIELIENCKPSFWDEDPLLYNVYCNALEEADQIPKALEWYDKGMEAWPLNASIVYNKGVTLWADKQYEEALKVFERTLELNPFHWYTHRQLGIICANEGYLTEAMMCFNMCLLSEYDYYYSAPILEQMYKISSSNYSGESEGVNIYGEDGVSPHEELSLFIKNRVALDKKKYKFKHKFSKEPIIRQNHLLVNNIQYDSDDDSFWGRYYTKHFSNIVQKKGFESFGYGTFMGFADANPKIGKTILKKKAIVVDYLIWARENWGGYFSEIEVPFKGELAKKDVYRWNSGTVYLIGYTSEEDADGYGETYNTSGSLSGKGSYNNGEKDGFWVNYHPDGSVSGEYNYKNGEPEGLSVYYDEFGDRQGSLSFVDGELDGPSSNYQAGVLNYSGTLGGKGFDGPFKSFFPDGKVKSSYTMDEGAADGEFRSYYANGKLETEFTRVDGEIQGEIKTYFPDGKLYKSVQFEDDEENGPFVFYYYNGNKSSEGEYKNGKKIGTYKTYFNDGTLSTEIVFDESGKETGIETNYVNQGWKISEFDYKKGEVVAYRFYDKDGNTVKEDKRKGGQFYYEPVDKDGTITAKGTYASGDKGEDGEWKYFDRNDYLTSVVNYDDGEREGLYTSYYANGQIDVECNYEEGNRNGYYKQNYRQGQIYVQGWIDEGEQEGLWEYYYEDGTISERNYYIDDELHGYAEDYSPDGVRYFAGDYRFGNLMGLVIFDTTGVELNYYPIDTGLVIIEQYSAFGYLEAEKVYNNRSAYGEWRWYHPNKQISSTGVFVDGDRDGKWTWYHHNGKISQEGSYFLGKQTGEWRSYYENGQLDEIEFFEYGELTGMNTNYYDNGKLATEIEYVLGTKHGLAKYYNSEGKLQMMRNYEFDEIISIAIDNLDSDNPTWITLKDETGDVVTKYPNGKTARSYSIKKGEFQGEYLDYYDNGQLLDSQNYLDGERHGEYKAYYKDGTLEAEGNYVHGELIGEYLTYHPNGKLETKSTYVNGEAHGWSEEYNAQGKLILREYYYAGSLEIIEKL